MQIHQSVAFSKAVNETTLLIEFGNAIMETTDEAKMSMIEKAYDACMERVSKLLDVAGVVELPWDHAHRQIRERAIERKRGIDWKKKQSA